MSATVPAPCPTTAATALRTNSCPVSAYAVDSPAARKSIKYGGSTSPGSVFSSCTVATGATGRPRTAGGGRTPLPLARRRACVVAAFPALP
jgi:hypothetical protein